MLKCLVVFVVLLGLSEVEFQLLNFPGAIKESRCLALEGLLQVDHLCFQVRVLMLEVVYRQRVEAEVLFDGAAILHNLCFVLEEDLFGPLAHRVTGHGPLLG